MRFELIHIWRTGEGVEAYKYQSFCQKELQAYPKHFASRDEMVVIMTGIVAAQSRKGTFDEPLRLLEANGSFDFTGENGLDLTDEQAELLGWPKTSTKK